MNNLQLARKRHSIYHITIRLKDKAKVKILKVGQILISLSQKDLHQKQDLVMWNLKYQSPISCFEQHIQYPKIASSLMTLQYGVPLYYNHMRMIDCNFI